MKRIKKILISSCLAGLVVFSLAACSSENGSNDDKEISIEGKWKKTVNTLEVKNETAIDFYSGYLENNSVTWTISSDGAVTIDKDSINDGKKSVTGSWTLSDNILTIVDPSMSSDKQKSTYTYNMDDGNIYFNDEGEKYYRFEKQ